MRAPTTGRYVLGNSTVKPGRWALGAFHSSTRYDDFTLDPPMTGSIAISQIDAAWVCGSIDIAGHGAHVRGRFAAERVDAPY